MGKYLIKAGFNVSMAMFRWRCEAWKIFQPSTSLYGNSNVSSICCCTYPPENFPGGHNPAAAV